MLSQASKNSVLLSRQQEEWVKVQRLCSAVKPQIRFVRPIGQDWPKRIKRMLYDLGTSTPFEWFIIVVIAANMLLMAMAHADMTPQWQVSCGAAPNVAAAGLHAVSLNE